MHRYWFKPKRYGFGAVPTSWEGWACAALAVLCILIEMQVIPARYLDPDKGRALMLLAQIATAAAFLFVCHLKTEGAWRWRWGEDR